MHNKNDIETLMNTIGFEKNTIDEVLEKLDKNKEITIYLKTNSYRMYNTIILRKIDENRYDINLDFNDWYKKKNNNFLNGNGTFKNI